MVFAAVLGTVYAVIRWGNLNTNRHSARLFSWGALKILGIKLRLKGEEYLEGSQPCVYVANHQSALDVATFGAIYPSRTLVIGKKELLWLPFFGLYFIAAGNILINRQKRVKAILNLSHAVKAVQNRLASIWIFPEGTRSRGKVELLPFKKGAFMLAIQAGVPLVPIVCAPLETLMDGKTRKFRKGTLTIQILPPIQTHPRQLEDLDLLIQEVREKMLKAIHGLKA